MKVLIPLLVFLVAGVWGARAAEQSPATKRLMSRFEKGKLATNPHDWGKIDFNSSQIKSGAAGQAAGQGIKDSIIKISDLTASFIILIKSFSTFFILEKLFLNNLYFEDLPFP